MGKMTIKGLEEYMSKLTELGKNSIKICEDAVKVGGGIVADEVRTALQGLPEEEFRLLKESEKFTGVPKSQKKDLLDCLGITPVITSRDGIINVKIGFDGYGSYRSKKYPNGIPNPLLARAIESGSSVRQKTPFIRKAVNRCKKRVLEEMGKSIESDMKNYTL